jgi:hypothetical protein
MQSVQQPEASARYAKSIEVSKSGMVTEAQMKRIGAALAPILA